MALFAKIRERVTGNGNSLRFDSLEQISKNEDTNELNDQFDKENNSLAHNSHISVFTREPLRKPSLGISSVDSSSKRNEKFVNILPSDENFPNQSVVQRTVNATKTASFHVLEGRDFKQEAALAAAVSKDNRFATSRTVSNNSLLPGAADITKNVAATGSSKTQVSLENDVLDIASEEIDESFEVENDYLEQIFSKARHNHGPVVLEAIRKGFDVNSIDSNGNTLMHICAQNNHRKLAVSILQNFPSCTVGLANFKGLTPLDYSQKYGFEKMSAWLTSISSIGAISGTQYKPVATLLR